MPNYPFPAAPTHVPAPFADIIDLPDVPTSDEECDDSIVYPLVQDLLIQLDLRYPGTDYSQYSQIMVAAGFSRVDQIRDSRRTRAILIHQLAIPTMVVDQIISHARHLQRKTEKMPANVQVIKSEDS